MTLRIKPVRLNKSIYIRVPNDIADLIGIDHLAELTLSIVDRGDEFLLVYSGQKPRGTASPDLGKESKIEGVMPEVPASPRIMQSK